MVNLLKGLPDKWDLADDLPSGLVRADLVKMLEKAMAAKSEPDLRAMFNLCAAASDTTVDGAPDAEDRTESDEQIILRLAGMAKLEYERVRNTWAKLRAWAHLKPGPKPKKNFRRLVLRPIANQRILRFWVATQLR